MRQGDLKRQDNVRTEQKINEIKRSEAKRNKMTKRKEKYV